MSGPVPALPPPPIANARLRPPLTPHHPPATNFPRHRNRSLDMTNRDKFVTRLSNFRVNFKEFARMV